MQPFWTLEAIAEDRTAVIFPDGASTSYGDLLAAARVWEDRISQALRLNGIFSRSALVALDFVQSVEGVAAYLGVLRGGWPLLVLEPGRLVAGRRFDEVWSPEVHLRADEQAELVMVVRPILTDTVSTFTVMHEDLKLLLSTSGSTGDPKLVRLSAQNIAANAASIVEYLGILPDDRTALTLPLNYSYGLSVLNSHLQVGAAVVLTDHSVSSQHFWQQAKDLKFSSIALVPHQFALLERSGFTGNEVPTLRYITQAGGKLQRQTVLRFAELGRQNGWDLVVMYGQTEASPRISFVPPAHLISAADTIGQAIPGGRLWIEDEDGNEIAEANRAGELVYAGPNVMLGYATSRADLALGNECVDCC